MMCASNPNRSSRWLALGMPAHDWARWPCTKNAFAQADSGKSFGVHWAVISKSGTTWKDEVPILA